MRVLLLILDSVGVGALPDADFYGDAGSNTLGNVARALGGLRLPNLEQLGLGHIVSAPGISKIPRPKGAYGKMAEAAPGKDTITGHWELAGVIVPEPFKTYPEGFPPEIMDRFEEAIGRGTLGNFAASGTEIIDLLGPEHMVSRKPIVYTSADSVFQIAAHEEVIPLEEQYRICQVARELMRGEYNIARIIARPFVGSPGDFRRTANRRDYAVEPHRPTILDQLTNAGRKVIGVGKIKDIFAGRGVTESHKTQDNQHGMQVFAELTQAGAGDLIFVNLVDFDMVYGHRNNAAGYGKALEEADAALGEILSRMQDCDILIVTADHGCDPTHPGTDHTREYVPLLVAGKQVRAGTDLGVRATFADVAATIGQLLQIDYVGAGTSFAGEILEG